MKLGLLLIAIAFVTALPLLDEDINRVVAENSTCNERPCTESETRTISAAATSLFGIPGLFLFLRGIGLAVRGRDSIGPAAGSGIGGLDEGSRKMALIARLDARYGSGEMDNDTYFAERERILGNGS